MIKVLDNLTINKIAAGEVVERPSSVVKELIENSIDAGATKISVNIKDGGIGAIHISDNGCGIPRDQVKTAFIRHATSKMQAIEDLDSIMTLGFRGEALASIAAVSQLEMVTKTADDDMGIQIEFAGGKLVSESECVGSAGTLIVVRNLFYNIPARKKFLKRPAMEGSYISDMISRIALGHPEISFRYSNNETEVLTTSGNNDLTSAVYSVYGRDISKKMLDICYPYGDFCLSGLIGKPEIARANRTYQNFFINGRFVKSDIVQAAVEEAYKTRLPIGKFALFVLNLQVPSDCVDVNVHPTKLEVRFNDDNFIYELVLNAVTDCLKKQSLIHEASFYEPPKKAIVTSAFDEAKNVLMNLNMNEQPQEQEVKTAKMPEVAPEVTPVAVQAKPSEGEIYYRRPKPSMPIVMQEPEPEQTELIPAEPSKRFFINYKIIGQLFSTYWIVEQDQKMYIIDQHAAHERILFEKLSNMVAKNDTVSQMLLVPVAVRLSERETIVLEDNFEAFSQLGFEMQKTIEGYELVAVPQIFARPEKIGYINDLIDEYLQTPTEPNVKKLEVLASAACKAAVKANDSLSMIEAKQMIDGLLELENPFTCPHGRPTIIEMTKYELEKKFKRV